MSVKLAFGAKVSETGNLLFDCVGAFRGYMRGLAGKRVRVVVTRETRGRTLPQNAWLLGVIEPLIAEWSGHTPEEIHEVMLKLHGIKALVDLPGCGQVLVIKRTSKLTTGEFSDYVERVRAWAASQGLNIPDPGRLA